LTKLQNWIKTGLSTVGATNCLADERVAIYGKMGKRFGKGAWRDP